MKKVLILIVLFLLISCHQKEKTDFGPGILWQIESELGTQSYIFGTFHFYPKSEFELSEKIIAKLQSCNVLALERRSGNPSEQQGLNQFEMPRFVIESNNVLVAEYGDDLVSMERELLEKALESEMSFTGLESVGEILQIMEAVSEIKIDETQFVKDQMLKDYEESFKQYKNGLIDKYYQSLTARLGEEMTELLIDERNRNWVNNIENLIKNDKVFIAVGIGHLGGENGILNLLAEEGYRVTKVK